MHLRVMTLLPAFLYPRIIKIIYEIKGKANFNFKK